MLINRRAILKGLALAAAGLAAGDDLPAYSNFFGAPVRPDRYTRNMYDLTASRIVAEPSLRGGHSLEMEFTFSEKDRYGVLLWDLAPIQISRIRLNVFNPNSSRYEIFMKTSLSDTEGRIWQLDPPSQLLTANRWTEVDAELAKTFRVSKGKEQLASRDIYDAVFSRITLRFEVGRDFPSFEKPLLLYLDGVELF